MPPELQTSWYQGGRQLRAADLVLVHRCVRVPTAWTQEREAMP